MSSNPSSQTRIQLQPGGAPARPGSAPRGPIVLSSGGSTPPIDDQPTVISKDVPVGVPLAIANLAPAEMGRLLLGQRLGHYDLLEFVGGGGMGAVFKAHDTMLDRVVAVKVLSKVQSDDEETLRRFKNEAQSAARLDHDNIGRVHYVGEDRGWHYIVFEYIEGVNLRDLVARDGPLPLVQAVSYTLQIADALAHASQRDVVHRDIKPSNVLITPEGRAKLVDMGLARLHQVAQPENDLTASGVTLGTFDYISPEQARDPRDADVRSDLYSLGCTLYYALTGRPPFPEGTVLQKLLQHQADDPTDARQLRTDLPEEMGRILKNLLAKSPQHRYQRPDDLVSDLLALAARYGLEVPPPVAAQRLATVPAEPSRWVRHLPWLVPLGVLGAVVFWFAWFGAARDDDSGPPPIRRTAMREETTSSDARSQPAPGEARSVATQGIAPSTGGNSAADESVKTTETDTPPGAVASIQKTASPADGSSKPAAVKSASVEGAPAPGSPNLPSIGELLEELRGKLDSLGGGQSPLQEPQSQRANSTTPAPTTVPAASSHSTTKPGPPSISQAPNAVPSNPLPPSSPPSGSAPKSLPPDANPTSPDDADNPPTAAPTAPAANVTPAAGGSERKGPLIVDPAIAGPRPPGSYPTLADACRAARNGDVIEVRSSAPLHERPIDLVGVRLTIRSDEGFSPVVYFQPQKADPLRDSHSMLTLAGSQLTLAGLRLEFDVPRDAAAESWSLAEIRPGESLRLDDCAVTVRDALDPAGGLHPQVSMFDIRAVPGPGMMSTDDAPAMRPPALLQLKNCILRGEATVVRSDELQPVQITWNNGLLATSERLLSAAGGSSDPKPQGETHIELRHVTALMRSGMCRLTNTQDAPQQLPLDIAASDCIFLCDPSAALIEQSGIDATDDYRRRIVWNGERNFYESFATFWRINAAGAETPAQSTFHDWQTYWGSRESQPSLGKVVWQQLPPPSRAASVDLPSDFALHAGENPALRSAADGSDAGLRAALLPRIAAPAATAPKPTTTPLGNSRPSDSPPQ